MVSHSKVSDRISKRLKFKYRYSRSFRLNPKTKGYVADKNLVRTIRKFPVSGILPRVQISEIPGDTIAGIPTENLVCGEIENLPEYNPGTFYIPLLQLLRVFILIFLTYIFFEDQAEVRINFA